MDWENFIEQNDKILVGKPVLKGTRISVEHLINLMASGWTESEILNNYPRLTRNHLLAVFAFIGDCMKDGLFYSDTLKSAS